MAMESTVTIPRVDTALWAGVACGVVGLLVFLTIHHFWIQPIWFILPMGLPLAGAGGAAVGWAYAELFPALPARPWTAPALVGLIAVILAPAVMLAELRQPLFEGLTAETATLRVSVGRAAFVFVAELLVTTAAVGALAGWWIGGSGRAAFASAAAGLIFALGPGHNIPFLGSTPAAGKGALILLAVVAVSAVVLVEVELRLRGGPLVIGE